jgi:hypothetical protein
MHVTQIGYSDVQSFDYSPVPPSPTSALSRTNSTSNACTADDLNTITRTGSDQMAVVERRRQLVGPLHIQNTPHDEPPPGSNTINHLKLVLIDFAKRIVENDAVASGRGNTHGGVENDPHHDSGSGRSRRKPRPAHFGVATHFIRGVIKSKRLERERSDGPASGTGGTGAATAKRVKR